MEDEKKHLNIDLEFLDKNEPSRVAPKPESSKGNEPTRQSYNQNNTNSNSGKRYNWKNILIIGGIILFLGWGFFSGNGSSDDTPSSTNSKNYGSTNSNYDNNVATGQYMCSQYNHDHASELEPSKSQEAVLEAEENSLSLEGDRLSEEKDQLENEYVDEYDQYSLDTHNAAVDDLNIRLVSYRRRLAQHSQAIDTFNAKIEVYNNYLTQNCTPQ